MVKLYGLFAVLALAGAVFAAGTDEFAAGKQLVDSKANCSTLSQAQLESIGDYIMEIQHPGQAHIYMESMMGGEGSESLKNAHMQMAEILYCGRTDVPVTYGGMMGLGALSYSGGVMGRGIGSYGGMMGLGATASPYAYGMMGNYGYSSGYGISLVDILLVVLLIGLIIAVYAYIWQAFGKGKKKGKSG